MSYSSPKLLDLRRERRDSLVNVDAFGKLHVIAITRDAARLQQIRLRRDFAAECKRAARTTRAADASPGIFFSAPAIVNSTSPILIGSPDFALKLKKQALLDNGAQPSRNRCAALAGAVSIVP